MRVNYSVIPMMCAMICFGGHCLAMGKAGHVTACLRPLWKEGIPYVTLLHNTINHPDDRGHRLFAEELWKCFE